MLYPCLKILVRLMRPLFCRTIHIDQPALLKEKGPLLLAANHPNSFLDAIILDTLFEQPIWSLARGDVFKTPRLTRLLTAMKILPVYRVSEGVENLNANYDTFDACKNIFQKNGLVLIFSEGRCINEWHLRPLKKGTARLAISSWNDGIPLRVLPVCINYSSFRRFGKNLFISFGKEINASDLPTNVSEGLKIQAFNQLLHTQLSQGVYEIEKKDTAKQKAKLQRSLSDLKCIILFVPAILGSILHAPLYIPIQRFTLKKASHNDHYDSILITLLFLLYIPYLLLLSFILFFLTASYYSFLLLALLPFTAWAWMQVNEQLDGAASGGQA